MDFEGALQSPALSLGEVEDQFRESAKAATWPPPHPAESWIGRDVVVSAARRLKISDDVTGSLGRCADWICTEPSAVFLAHACRSVLKRSQKWPQPKHERGGLFHAVVLLTLVDQIVEENGHRGIPEQVTLETLTDVEVWIRESKNWHPSLRDFGFFHHRWLQNHFSGRLHRLGRLQFEICEWDQPFFVMQEAESGRVVAMANAGQKFRHDGLPDGLNTLSTRWHGRPPWTKTAGA